MTSNSQFKMKVTFTVNSCPKNERNGLISSALDFGIHGRILLDIDPQCSCDICVYKPHFKFLDNEGIILLQQ